MAKETIDPQLTTKEAAEIAGVDARTIRRWIEAGSIEAHQLPGGPTMPYLVSQQSLLTFLKQRADQVVA